MCVLHQLCARAGCTVRGHCAPRGFLSFRRDTDFRPLSDFPARSRTGAPGRPNGSRPDRRQSAPCRNRRDSATNPRRIEPPRNEERMRAVYAPFIASLKYSSSLLVIRSFVAGPFIRPLFSAQACRNPFEPHNPLLPPTRRSLRRIPRSATRASRHRGVFKGRARSTRTHSPYLYYLSSLVVVLRAISF